ncbi:anaerobic ribonucleoside-triphosphate reductase activating protein [Patescibacteria group bacterium]|nr:anaerobic ribonucleoside-triphosphate reductase activating protein [Patescibacteria group bacterium]MBU4480725.1 anaerobic ribonucleoside-triphosphate reductase activating protein [Patescibacteria group bacterium]
MMETTFIQKITLIDFPGKIACTIFSIGCPFRCPFCHNKELVLPDLTKKQPRISQEEIFNFLKEKRGLLDGVCITGGEPTIHEDLPDFCRKLKDLGFLVKLDTNGYDPERVKKLIDEKLIDYLALDVKAPKEKYGKLIGIDNKVFVKIIVQNIERSVEILKEGKIDFEFRTTVVPTLLEREDILEIGKWLSSLSPGQKLPKYYLQNFRPEKTLDPSFEKIKPYPQEYLLEIQKALSPFFEICQAR